MTVDNSRMQEIVGRNIRTARNGQGLSLRRFAAMVGMDYSHLSNLERGKVDPNISTVIKIAEGLDVPIAQLFKE